MVKERTYGEVGRPANNPDILTGIQESTLLALEANMGLITKTVKEVGISLATFYRWKDESEVFLEGVALAREAVKDFGESALHALIRSGNPQAIVFYNKTKNKDRGYVEKKEIEHSQSEPIAINVIMPSDEDN